MSAHHLSKEMLLTVSRLIDGMVGMWQLKKEAHRRKLYGLLQSNGFFSLFYHVKQLNILT